jgi:hypothetical protein
MMITTLESICSEIVELAQQNIGAYRMIRQEAQEGVKRQVEGFMMYLVNITSRIIK